MIDLLNRAHNRNRFDCGIPSLNDYLKHQASQDMRRKLSACFVLSNKPKDIQGYYILSKHSIPFTIFPDALRKKMRPTYHSIPVTLLERMAVDLIHQGKGLGRILLMDALKRIFEASLKIDSHAVVVHPVNPVAKAFYSKYGFIQLPDSGKMVLGMKTLAELDWD